MSFQESIIIPLSLFKECKLDEGNLVGATQPNILNNTMLNSEEKMKLYNQQKLMDRIKMSPMMKPAQDSDNTIFTDNIADKYKPYVISIVNFMRRHPDEVGWDRDYKIRIGPNIIPSSNLNETLRHFMKSTVVTRDSDIPPGTYQLVEKLFDLGMPKSWIPARFVFRKSERESKSGSWLRY